MHRCVALARADKDEEPTASDAPHRKVLEFPMAATDVFERFWASDFYQKQAEAVGDEDVSATPWARGARPAACQAAFSRAQASCPLP